MKLLFIPALLVNVDGAFADSSQSGCAKQSSAQTAKFDKLSSRYTRCRTLREKEFRNISYKRDRYLRLIEWATELDLGNSLREYIEGLREYDYFIRVKTSNFKSCIAALPAISVLDRHSESDCTNSDKRPRAKIDILSSHLNACHDCGLAKIQSGISDSAIELLVVQQKNARKIREILFKKLSKQRNLDLAAKYPWQIVRDVFLPFVTDSSLKLSNSQQMIVILGQLELSSASMKNFDKSTDDIISVYRQLEKTLASDDDDISKQAELFWQDYVRTIKKYHRNEITRGPLGIDNADVFTRYITLNKSRFRETLAPVLDIAVNQYQTMRQQ